MWSKHSFWKIKHIWSASGPNDLLPGQENPASTGQKAGKNPEKRGLISSEMLWHAYCLIGTDVLNHKIFKSTAVRPSNFVIQNWSWHDGKTQTVFMLRIKKLGIHSLMLMMQLSQQTIKIQQPYSNLNFQNSVCIYKYNYWTFNFILTYWCSWKSYVKVMSICLPAYLPVCDRVSEPELLDRFVKIDRAHFNRNMLHNSNFQPNWDIMKQGCIQGGGTMILNVLHDLAFSQNSHWNQLMTSTLEFWKIKNK